MNSKHTVGLRHRRVQHPVTCALSVGVYTRSSSTRQTYSTSQGFFLANWTVRFWEQGSIAQARRQSQSTGPGIWMIPMTWPQVLLRRSAALESLDGCQSHGYTSFNPIRWGRSWNCRRGLGCVQSGKPSQWLPQDAHQACSLLRCILWKQWLIRAVRCLPRVSAAWTGDTCTQHPCGHGGSHCWVSASMGSQKWHWPVSTAAATVLQSCLTGEEAEAFQVTEERQDGQRGSHRAGVGTQACGTHSRSLQPATSCQENTPFSCPS